MLSFCIALICKTFKSHPNNFHVLCFCLSLDGNLLVCILLVSRVMQLFAARDGRGVSSSCHGSQWSIASVFIHWRRWWDNKIGGYGQRTRKEQCCLPLFVHARQVGGMPSIVDWKVWAFLWGCVPVLYSISSNKLLYVKLLTVLPLPLQQSYSRSSIDGEILSSKQSPWDCSIMEKRSPKSTFILINSSLLLS